MNNTKNSGFGNGGGLRIKPGARYMGMAQSTYYDRVDERSPRHDPALPKAVSIGPRTRVLLISEMDAYLEAKTFERDARRTKYAYLNAESAQVCAQEKQK